MLMKRPLNEGRTSGLNHLGSLPSPYRNPISSWGRKSLGSITGRGWEEHKSQVTHRVPRQRTEMELIQTSCLTPRSQNFTQKMLFDNRALDRSFVSANWAQFHIYTIICIC